jgi:hypothetical protein
MQLANPCAKFGVMRITQNNEIHFRNDNGLTLGDIVQQIIHDAKEAWHDNDELLCWITSRYAQGKFLQLPVYLGTHHYPAYDADSSNHFDRDGYIR